MSNLLFTGILALLIVLVAHVGLKLYVFEEHMETLEFQDEFLNIKSPYNKNNNNNNNNNNNSEHPNLWNELIRNNPNSHKAISYGPASARTQHAYQGRRGNFNGVVPNYPVLATENEVHDLQESLKKDQKQWNYIRYLLTNPTKIYEMLNKLNRNKVTKE